MSRSDSTVSVHHDLPLATYCKLLVGQTITCAYSCVINVIIVMKHIIMKNFYLILNVSLSDKCWSSGTGSASKLLLKLQKIIKMDEIIRGPALKSTL